jgi:hypothetical protein
LAADAVHQNVYVMLYRFWTAAEAYYDTVQSLESKLAAFNAPVVTDQPHLRDIGICSTSVYASP